MSVGSTLVHAPDEALLAELAADVDALDRIAHVSLAVLCTLDFEQLVSPPLSWSAPEPVAFDEGSGVAILRVQPEALAFLIEKEPKLSLDAEQRVDVARIRDFVAAHGRDAIYEMATF